MLLAAVSFPFVDASAGTGNYLPSIGIDAVSVSKVGREVELRMSVDLTALKIHTQHTLALIPVIVSGDGSREAAFPPVVIDGKTRGKVYLRARRLESVGLPPYHDGDAAAVIFRENGKSQKYDYSASVPYSRWMLDGRLEIREEVHGCVDCKVGSDSVDVSGVLPEYVPEYRLGVVAPETEPAKSRTESRTAMIAFRQDSHRIRPEYRNNRAELDSVANSITEVIADPALEITGISITGYASPEATEEYNLRLSGKRADALKEYITSNWDIAPGLIRSKGVGEDWEGFVSGLDECPGLAGLDRIKALLAEYSGRNDLCESMISRLEPSDIYARLLNEVYPSLRRLEYEIRYEVRNFSLEEASNIIRERPWLLSLGEMYMVAASCGKGSEGYRMAMETAFEYYPDSPAVVNDRAQDLISSGQYDAAVELLGSFAGLEGQAELLNTLGVALARLGRLDRASECLREAVSLGGTETAAHNLEELKRVIDQL